MPNPKTSKPYVDRLRQNLLALTRERGMTLEKLALEAEISKSHLSMILGGHSSPSLKTLQDVSEVLKVDILDLLATVKRR
jgi:transcriptional regulator with XRE-family HTH domain